MEPLRASVPSREVEPWWPMVAGFGAITMFIAAAAAYASAGNILQKGLSTQNVAVMTQALSEANGVYNIAWTLATIGSICAVAVVWYYASRAHARQVADEVVRRQALQPPRQG